MRYTPQIKYSFVVNELADGEETQTLKVIHIEGAAHQRCALLRKFLRHTYNVDRKTANKIIVEMGFDDLIPCAA